MPRVKSTKPRSPSASAEVDFGKFETIKFETVEYLRLDQITVLPGNPRQHPSKNLEAIARAIVATGIMTPLVVNSRNELASGEGRLGAAALLKLTKVPVLRAEALTEEQFLAYRIADNRITDLSSFGETSLALALKHLSSLSLTFNIEHIGFDLPEIDIRIDGLSAGIQSGDEAGDALPAPRGTAVSRVGDVWTCEKHRLICGSALDPLVYQALLRGQLAQMSIQDPPYNVSIGKHVGGQGATKHREFAMASGEMSEVQFAEFLQDEIALAQGHLEKGAITMVFMDWRSIDKLIFAGKHSKLELINLCVWNKSNASMGSLYRSKHELVAIFKKPGARHKNNVQLGRFGRYRTNVWDAPGCNSFSASRMQDLEAHPTVKPFQLVADAIRDVSHRGDIVLDSFGGSGTTMIAAERTGRIAYLIELDPLYVDTTVRRWQNFSGREAILESTGQTFAATAAARATEAALESTRTGEAATVSPPVTSVLGGLS